MEIGKSPPRIKRRPDPASRGHGHEAGMSTSDGGDLEKILQRPWEGVSPIPRLQAKEK